MVALDLRSHEAIVEHSDGRVERVPLTPNRSVAEVTVEVLAAVRRLGGPVEINLTPQETPWTTPLDEDHEHATYEPAQVATYFAAATQSGARARGAPRALSRPLHPGQRVVGLVRPRREPLLRPACRAAGERTSSPVTPGTPSRSRSAGGPATPATRKPPSSPTRSRRRRDSQPPRWHRRRRGGTPTLGEYILDWDDLVTSPHPHEDALEFARSAVRHGCDVCSWDPDLSASAERDPASGRLTDSPTETP